MASARTAAASSSCCVVGTHHVLQVVVTIGSVHGERLLAHEAGRVSGRRGLGHRDSCCDRRGGTGGGAEGSERDGGQHRSCSSLGSVLKWELVLKCVLSVGRVRG
eukprot:20084_1